MKRSFSLVEVLVGMMLFSLLASLLFGLYLGFVKYTKQQKTEEKHLESLIILKAMLDKSLGQAVLETKQQYFKEEQGALYFTFDNGVDPDPLFSSILRGVLRLDEEDNFILEMSPLQGGATRTYVLQKAIRDLSFECLPREGLPMAVQISLNDKHYTVLLAHQPPLVRLS